MVLGGVQWIDRRRINEEAAMKPLKEFLIEEREKVLWAGDIRACFIFSSYLERYLSQERKFSTINVDIDLSKNVLERCWDVR